ncbi:MAG: hypothetical protein NZ518_07765, partial [Dehalococcoidia bacterium]|nr:hypothetical protein [Dehalococcoidia bacterium]
MVERLDWRAVAVVVGVWAASRLALFVVVFFGLVWLPPNGDDTYLPSRTDNILLYGLGVWDGGWYQRIAMDGYRIDGLDDGRHTAVAFFPLYPLV